MRTFTHSCLGLVASWGIAMSAAQAQGPSPNDVYFHSNVTHGGNGCPQGTVGQAFSEDRRFLTLFFDSYSVEVGPSTPSVVTKNCNLSLPIHIPNGWRYTIIDVAYSGYLFLDANVQASQQSEYSFQGLTGPRAASNWTGPKDEFWRIGDRLQMTTNEWSRCGEQRNLNIKTYLQVTNRRNRAGSGSISNDTIEGSVIQSYGIMWQRC